MKIGNVRIGFATNSSSSHSIALVRDPSKVRDDIGEVEDTYGWERFMLASPRNKLEYLAAQMYSAYQEILGERIANLLIKDFFGDKIDEVREGVDHQSCFSVPLTRDNKDIPEEFMKALVEFFENEEVVIAGGNDNSDTTSLENLDTKYELFQMPDLWGGAPWVKKQKNGWWTFFLPSKGSKANINFNNHAHPLEKARTPDLVDLKITDYCDAGCAYCYQDSTKKGKHAAFQDIQSYMSAFKEMEVFEVALGGGEPTKHPVFINILKEFREEGIVPNFSTRSFDWMNDIEIVRAVDKYAGKVGFSCSTQDDVRALIYHINKSGLDRQKFVVHYVLGSSPIEELKKILATISNASGIGVLFLGYKETGRGCNFTPYDNSQWHTFINDYWIDVGIDTCVANQYQKELEDLSVHELMYYTEEGKFSFYVDAVENKVARSSFEKNPEDYISVKAQVENDNRWWNEPLMEKLQEIFNGF